MPNTVSTASSPMPAAVDTLASLYFSRLAGEDSPAYAADEALEALLMARGVSFDELAEMPGNEFFNLGIEVAAAIIASPLDAQDAVRAVVDGQLARIERRRRDEEVSSTMRVVA